MEEKRDGRIWEERLAGIDPSPLDKGKMDEYPTIRPDEISGAYESSILKGHMMRFANDVLRGAREQAQGLKPRERINHDMGWSLSIETPQGIIGLWSCWLGNQFYLGFPKSVVVSDDLIMKTLKIEKAKPIRQVNATAVIDPNYIGEYADPDKPLEQNTAGQTVGYQDVGDRLWAKFYGPIEPTGGRVWVDYSDFHSMITHFPYIDKRGKLQSVPYGHEQSKGIHTAQFSFYNQYTPEGPTADPSAIQKYKDRFIDLAAEITFIMGGPISVNMDYGFSMVPEDLHREGYDVKWLKGEYGERQGWGNEIVRGKKGDSTIILKSGNSIVPWSTILNAPVSGLTSPETLSAFIKEEMLFF